MKHGVNPTRKEKLAMVKANLACNDWLVCKRLFGGLCLEHRLTGEVKVLRIGGTA